MIEILNLNFLFVKQPLLKFQLLSQTFQEFVSFPIIGIEIKVVFIGDKLAAAYFF